MYCSNCGGRTSDSNNFCEHCGAAIKPTRVKQKKPTFTINLFILIVLLIGVGYFIGKDYFFNEKDEQVVAPVQQLSDTDEEEIEEDNEEIVKETNEQRIIDEEDELREVAVVIEEAQRKVYTLYNDYGQGSGFLINDNGDILTNAHVVEGDTRVIVRDFEGKDYFGVVVGYSNEVDIAVVRVPDLVGTTPLDLEKEKASNLGDEVIALGSPVGLANTATLGNISGVDRTFYIEPHTYDGIYQISAPISPGSRSGPLLDRKTEKVIGINSARHEDEATIGFSIPLFKVMDMINDWIRNPMSEDEIYSLFFNVDGLYYYQDFYDYDYYFDGGYYDEEDDFYYYYDYLTDTYYIYDPYTDEYYYYDYVTDEFYLFDPYEDWYYDYYDDEDYYDWYYDYYDDEDYYDWYYDYYNDEDYYDWYYDYYDDEDYYDWYYDYYDNEDYNDWYYDEYDDEYEDWDW